MTDQNSRAADNSIVWAFGIFAAALILRLIYLTQFQSTPLFANPVMDMKYHHDWAMALSQGSNPIDGPFFRAPLYPYFLAAIYWVGGNSDWIARVVQAIMGSCSAALVFVIGNRLFNRNTGVVAGLIVAAYGPLILYDAQLLIPSLVIFLNLAGIYALIRALEKPDWRFYSIAGLMLGLSAIARPTILLFAGAIFLYLIWSAKREPGKVKLSHILIFCIALMIPIAPVTAHNYAHSGQFTLIGTYSGLNFYIGNNQESDGVSAKLPGERRDWWGMMEGSERIANRESGRELSAPERSAFWMQKTLGEITSDPVRWFKHLGRKTLLLFEGTELSNNFDIHFLTRQTGLLKMLILARPIQFPYGILLPLAAVGLILAGWDRKRRLLLLFLIAYVPTLILFFVSARYRLPLVPILALFAGYSLTSGTGMFRSYSRPRQVIVVGIFATLLLVGNLNLSGNAPRNEAQGYYSYATIFEQTGRISEAEYHYNMALNEDSTLGEAYNNLGLMLVEQGRNEQAIDLLESAVTFADANYLTQYNLAYAYMKSNRPGDAIGLLQEALRLNNEMVDAAYNLALCFQRTGESDSATTAYRTALSIDASHFRSHLNLAQLLTAQNKPDSAIVHLDHFLRLHPEDDEGGGFARNLLDSLRTR